MRTTSSYCKTVTMAFALLAVVFPLFASAQTAQPAPPPAAAVPEDKLTQAVQAAADAAAAARDSARATQKLAEAMELQLKPPVCIAPAVPPPVPVKLSPWVYVLGLNIISETGNANAFAGKLGAKVTGNWTNWALLLQADGAYGQAETFGTHAYTTTALNADFLARGDRNFGDVFDGYLLAGTTTDHVASIDYTAFGEAGVSITWLLHKEADYVRTRLKTDLGFRYTNELDRQFYATATTPVGDLGPVRNIPAVRGAVSFLYALSKTSLFTEDAEVLYDVLDAKDVRFTSVTAISASVAKGLALSLSFKVRYIGVPAAGAVDTDTELAAGVTIAF